jgi:hypothetical protein
VVAGDAVVLPALSARRWKPAPVRLGGGVKLPEPFSFTLATESFVV